MDEALSTQPDPEPVRPSRLHWVFFGTDGIRAGWRLLIFLALIAILEFLYALLLRKIPGAAEARSLARSGTIPVIPALVNEVCQFILVIAASLFMARLERRSWFEYGLPLKRAFRSEFWSGALWGFAALTAVVVIISLSGGFSFGSVALSPSQIALYGAIWALIFVVVGLFEEFLFRGYAQYTLSKGIGFWPAAVIFSLIFAAGHLRNAGENAFGGIGVVLYGLFACFTLFRTGDLWFITGLHAAWDYGETFVYSVPNSGMRANGHLLNSNLHGPQWLSGGTVGPEASVVGLGVYIVLFLLFVRFYRRPAPHVIQPAPDVVVDSGQSFPSD